MSQHADRWKYRRQRPLPVPLLVDDPKHARAVGALAHVEVRRARGVTWLRGESAGEPEIERFGYRFRVRDKVIQTENDYDKEVFNGDIGQIASIDLVEREVMIRYDSRLVAYDLGELDEISPAYAISIHKARDLSFR